MVLDNWLILLSCVENECTNILKFPVYIFQFKLMLSHDGSGKGAAIVTAVANRLRESGKESIGENGLEN